MRRVSTQDRYELQFYPLIQLICLIFCGLHVVSISGTEQSEFRIFESDRWDKRVFKIILFVFSTFKFTGEFRKGIKADAGIQSFVDRHLREEVGADFFGASSVEFLLREELSAWDMRSPNLKDTFGRSSDSSLFSEKSMLSSLIFSERKARSSAFFATSSVRPLI
jgi:hypothetical protein